jgi:hypothetical protein
MFASPGQKIIKHFRTHHAIRALEKDARKRAAPNRPLGDPVGRFPCVHFCQPDRLWMPANNST